MTAAVGGLPNSPALAWVSGASPDARRLHGQLLQQELLGATATGGFADENARAADAYALARAPSGGVGALDGAYAAAAAAAPRDNDFGDGAAHGEGAVVAVSTGRTINSAAATAAALARVAASRRAMAPPVPPTVQLAMLSRSDAAADAAAEGDDADGADADVPSSFVAAGGAGSNGHTNAQLDASFAAAGGRPFARAPDAPQSALRRRILNFGEGGEALGSDDARQRRRIGAAGAGASPASPSAAAFSPAAASPRRSLPSDAAIAQRPLAELRALERSALSAASAQLLTAPRRARRAVGKVPYKVLDAPQLADDFYLNLLDWSQQNVLVVGLGADVYTWNAYTAKVDKLTTVGQPVAGAERQFDNVVTSVAWAQRGNHVAVGTDKGAVQVWDARTSQLVRTMSGHSQRACSLAWAGATLASGSRDKSILLRDLRSPTDFESKLAAHRQEVCGLRWSPDWATLASGGNDNRLMLWSAAQVRSGSHSTQPVVKFTQHTAAIKALAWSPHRAGLLASGGGTSDKCIRFFNCNTGVMEQVVDTGSQVCQLEWSPTAPELVSTHGYSTNAVVIWNYPGMSRVATLAGHTTRVLFMALSPDAQSIVTGAGDETLRFWHVFARDDDDRPIGTGSWLVADGAMPTGDGPRVGGRPVASLLAPGLSGGSPAFDVR